MFDFDGTLVDSNGIKRRAFESCFRDLKRRRREVIAYCVDHPHLTRTEKFGHVYEKIIGLPYSRKIEEKLRGRFEAGTTRQIVRAAAIPGAEEFLALGCRERLCGILSTTPHPILLHILRERGWEQFFRVVRGAPVQKEAWLERFRRRRRLKPSELIYFGDSPEDARAASEAGCLFIGLRDIRLRGKGLGHWNDFRGILAS